MNPDADNIQTRIRLCRNAAVGCGKSRAAP